MNLRALFHKPATSISPVPSDQNHRQANALEMLESGLLGFFPLSPFR
jgi:hypothetical protein